MRFKQIVETTTAGSVATVAQPMMTQTRENTNVRGLKPVQQVIKGKAAKKGPYANSIVESKVTEDDLAEQDLIVIPGQGRLRRTGFVKHDLDQGEHEGHTLKNSLHTIARAASDLDKRLSVQSEFPEWVSEKIGAAKGMMVTVMDYLISSQEMQHDSDAINEGEVSTSNLRTMYDLARMAKNYCNPEGQESLNELLKILKWYMDQAEQGVAEGLGKDIKRLATGKDVKSRAGQEIAKSQDASMRGDNKTSKKHFDRYDKLDKLANKDQGVAEGIDAAWDAAKKKVSEGSVPKEKQKTPYVDRNSPESKEKIQAARDKIAKDKAAEPGKKLADKIATNKKA